MDLGISLVVCCQLFVYIWEMGTIDEELSTQNKGSKLHVGKEHANSLEKDKDLATCLQGDRVYSLTQNMRMLFSFKHVSL